MFMFINLEKKVALIGAMIILFNAVDASALDAAYDRRGPFWGMGIGGAGDLAIPGANVGGSATFDFQLGAGATKNLTLSLDVDVTGAFFESESNLIFCPGPELNYFFGESGIFLRFGVAAAISVVWVGEQNEVQGGFQAGAGFGWEFFANTDLAVGAALEVDYMLRSGNDLVMFGMMFNMKYY